MTGIERGDEPNEKNTSDDDDVEFDLAKDGNDESEEETSSDDEDIDAVCFDNGLLVLM